MGSGAAFAAGKFTQYKVADSFCGVKLIVPTNKKKLRNTPMHSHTPNTMYMKSDTETEVIDQIAVYKDNNKIKDIDWSHDHFGIHIDGVHVHDYINGAKIKKPRKPTDEELALAKAVMAEDDKRRPHRLRHKVKEDEDG